MQSVPILSALVLAVFTGCATGRRAAPVAIQATVPIADASPVGKFCGPNPLMMLSLNSDGTYVVEISSVAGSWQMIEGNRVYNQRIPFAPEKGTWDWDQKTGELTLTINTPYSSRGKIQSLQFNRTNPDLLVRIGELFKRQKGTPLFFNSTEL